MSCSAATASTGCPTRAIKGVTYDTPVPGYQTSTPCTRQRLYRLEVGICRRPSHRRVPSGRPNVVYIFVGPDSTLDAKIRAR
jgi:hypothetical protein